jgi:hypothetical protein
LGRKAGLNAAPNNNDGPSPVPLRYTGRGELAVAEEGACRSELAGAE